MFCVAVNDYIFNVVLVHGEWSNWTPWSDCGITCGSGLIFRSRSCSNPTPSQGGDGCPGVSSEQQTCDTNVHCPRK